MLIWLLYLCYVWFSMLGLGDVGVMCVFRFLLNVKCLRLKLM